MEEHRPNYGFILTCTITILGWGITFGACQTRIDHNTKEIARLERLQTATTDNMQTISNQLERLDTKMDLLLDGRLVVSK